MITVQLVHGQEDRISIVLGPFEYVELTYNELWEPDRRKQIAYMNEASYWVHETKLYSDITITSA